MKKRFITKKRARTSYKPLFIFIILIFSLITTYKKIECSKLKINNKKIIELLTPSINKHTKPLTFKTKKTSMISIINNNYKYLVKEKVQLNNKKDKIPIIYLYNTHQTEEYRPSNYVEYSVKPTVTIADYIMKDYFDKNNFYTIVEERKIKEILNQNNWNYAYSYKASRLLMESAKDNNKDLKYFIDIHRDSVSRDKTTIKINNKSYAKIVFIIGLENSNYKNNLEFTSKINELLNKNYPNLSKGIYKKGGEGVNGIYNQDFSKNTILVEIGGKDNTIEEVVNTTIAFSKCFIEVISNNES